MMNPEREINWLEDRFSLQLAPGHPFTKRQAEILMLKVNEGLSNKEVGQRLGIDESTVVNLIASHYNLNTWEDTFKYRKSQLGIFGLVFQATGKRPQSFPEAFSIILRSGLLRQVAIEEPEEGLYNFSI